jgi:Tol biopolymer transport system component
VSDVQVCDDWVSYHTNRDGHWEIYRLGGIATGSYSTANLSKSPPGKDDLSPARSPDGKWIAFASNRDGNWEIYLATTDGAQVQRATFNTTASDVNPAWSPDGKAVVFESTRSGNWDLYLLDITSGEERRLTTSPGGDTSAFWSSDSARLLFQSTRDEIAQIYELDVAAGAERKISNGNTANTDPAYSPDGKTIAFTSMPAGKTTHVINVLTEDGQILTISDDTFDAVNPSWSSDGKLIAYEIASGTQRDIVVYDMQTGLQRLRTAESGQNFAPTWLCGSTSVVFSSTAKGRSTDLYLLNVEIDMANPEGSNAVKVGDAARQLTSDPAQEEYPQNWPSLERGSRRALLATAPKKLG